jgi:hypothetical protein
MATKMALYAVDVNRTAGRSVKTRMIKTGIPHQKLVTENISKIIHGIVVTTEPCSVVNQNRQLKLKLNQRKN